MVANVVDDGEVVLAKRAAQAASELLGPDDGRGGGTQHQDGVNAGHVHALVEHVDGEDDVEFAGPEGLQGR